MPDPIPAEEEIDVAVAILIIWRTAFLQEYFCGLDVYQLQAVVKNFVRRVSRYLHLATFFSICMVEDHGGDHPSDRTLNPDDPASFKCCRCSQMPTARKNCG